MFILNRTNDRATMPKRKIIGQAIAWFVAMFLLSAFINVGVTTVYKSMGIEPTQLTQFGGDISTHQDKPLLQTILLLIIIAPLVEEIIFRLGLSFKRQTVALWVGLLPVAIAGYLLQCYENWMLMAGMLVLGALLYWLVLN